MFSEYLVAPIQTAPPSARGVSSFLRSFCKQAEYPSKDAIQRLVRSYFKVFMKHFPYCFKSFIDFLDLETRKFVDVFLTDPSFRDSIVKEISVVCKLTQAGFIERALHDGLLLYDHDHFGADALRAINLRQQSTVVNLTEVEFGLLLIVSVYFHDVDELAQRLIKSVEWLLLDSSRRRLIFHFLWWMIDTFIVFDIHDNAGKNIPRKQWVNCRRFTNLTTVFNG